MSAFKKYLIILLLLLTQVSEVEDALSQTRYPGELNFAVEGIDSNEGWTVTYTSLSYPRWFDDHGEKYTTDEYNTGSISGSGNTNGYQGFDSPDDINVGVPIAYGEYLFTYEFDEHRDAPEVIIDLYDANWSTQNYPGSHDLYIKWNNNNKRFYYKNYCTNDNYIVLGTGSSGQYVQIWELFGVAVNQQPFKLPPPENFIWLNPNDYGEHPQFYWTEFDGSDGFTIKYTKISIPANKLLVPTSLLKI